MGPAQAMGTFLRVWRSEWARLSRAQLAASLRAVSPGASGVTARVIRRWEEGQPPATTDELEALLAVMRRRSLTGPEVDQFRKAVFAACVDRQYPEEFDGRDFVERPDVDEVAYDLRQRMGVRGPWEGGVVQTVACMEAVRPVVMDRSCRPASRDQERRQDLACMYLHLALANVHGSAGRSGLTAPQTAAARTLLEQRLGGRLSPWFTTDTLRAYELFNLAYETRSQTYLQELLALHDKGVATQDVWLRSVAIRCVADCLPWVSPRDGYIGVRALEGALLGACMALGDDKALAMAHYWEAGAALEAGDWPGVEGHLPYLEHWETSDGLRDQLCWHYLMGRFAAKRGDFAEADMHCRKAISLADKQGDHACADVCRKILQRCG